jgi:Ca-activated chloride channel family protein
MHRALFGILIASTLAACAPAPLLVAPSTAVVATDAPPLPLSDAPPPPALRNDDLAIQATDGPVKQGGPWIGAAGDSDFMLSGTNDTVLGVWVDVPSASSRARAPADVALVIDTSGSMAGPKIENARLAARELVDKLADGDIVSVFTFADAAQERVPPIVLTRENRPALHQILAALQPVGGTNMFDGLRWAEHVVLASPATHPVRRVVMISDGMANVGPSSPDVLGALAARGADGGVQISAIGVGSDYDEHTLNALAMRSSGRLYHLEQPREMTAILDREIGLLQATAATSAFIEIVPAPGVEILGADGVRLDRQAGGAAQIPLGTMFGGQHREMLLRVRVNAAGEGGRALASVRLHFHDPSDSGLDRVQEVVARFQVTSDRKLVEAHANEKTRTIAATQQAAQITIAAAQQLNDGRFEAADQQLAAAESQLKAAASRARSDADRQRVMAAADHIGKARAAAKVDAAAPPSAAKPAAARARALDVNAAGMRAYGY